MCLSILDAMVTKKKKPTRKDRRLIYLDSDLNRRLRVYAAEEGIPISTVAETAITAYLKSRKR